MSKGCLRSRIDPCGPASCGMFHCLEYLFRETDRQIDRSRAEAEAAWKAGDLEEFNRLLDEVHYPQKRKHKAALNKRLDRMMASLGAKQRVDRKADIAEQTARANEQGWRSAEGKAA